MNATKESVLEYIKENYSEEELTQQVDEAKSDYLNDDWEDEYENEEEAYIETGRGEAEEEVRTDMDGDILKHFGFGEDLSSYDNYEKAIGENVWDTIYEFFPFLNAN